MGKLEFGMRQGLAVDMQWDQRINDLRYQEQQKKQAQIAAKTEAKMYADDFQYNNAMNNFDNPKVKAFAQGKIREIGKYVNENPDWETNIAKRGQYTQMIRELKDNPDLMRGLQSDENWKAAQKDMSDTKNANIDFTPIKSQWDNYVKYGNQNGEEAAVKDGHKQFVYNAPAPPEDTTKLLVDLAQKTEYDMRNSFGYGGYRQSVSEARKKLAAEHAIASQWGGQLKKDYDAYVGGLKGEEKTNAKTINEFTLERMQPYFQSERIDKGFDPPVMKASSARGNGQEFSPSMWTDMHKKAAMIPGQKIDFGAEAMQHTFGNAVGEMNLDNIKTPLGDPINLGMRKATSTGIVEVHKLPGGKPYAEHKVLVRLPVEEFVALGSKYNKAIDEGGITQGITPIGNGDKNWDIHSEYKQYFKKITDEKGNAFVEFPTYQKYDPDNVNLADNYTNAHNVKQHEENPYNMGEEYLAQDEAGQKWITDAKGNVLRKAE